MSREQDPATTTDKPIVVGVDGSERNQSAVTWATVEAAAVGCDLVLVTAIEEHLIPSPRFSVHNREHHARNTLAEVRNEVRQVLSEHDVVIEVSPGSPVEVLLKRAKDARMVVVGKRGLSGFARVIVGSNSIALAGRATVPIAIVPDSWHLESHQDSPVVLGIDPYRPQHNPIHLAFSRADRLGVPLVAVHGRETVISYPGHPAAMAPEVDAWEKKADAEFDKVVDLWRERFPDVAVEAVHSHSHPAMTVLDQGQRAQLVVLGRHTDVKLDGFKFGSVTRAVLHYSECPVVVVPNEND